MHIINALLICVRDADQTSEREGKREILCRGTNIRPRHKGRGSISDWRDVYRMRWMSKCLYLSTKTLALFVKATWTFWKGRQRKKNERSLNYTDAVSINLISTFNLRALCTNNMRRPVRFEKKRPINCLYMFTWSCRLRWKCKQLWSTSPNASNRMTQWLWILAALIDLAHKANHSDIR